MGNSDLKRYLEFANLQLAAEAFWETDGPESGADRIQQVLRTGNTHASKFMPQQAVDFASEYEVLAHRNNDPRLPGGSGFSGTLFRNRATGELTLSFRSTEFVDDAVRDTKSTGELEIKELGWALGQIAEMEDWSTQLRADPNLLGGKTFNVTGYSLGGHLATAFNVLRREEAEAGISPNPITATYTFNGAGVGGLRNERRLTDVLAEFRRFRDDPSAANAELLTLPGSVRNALVSNASDRVNKIEAERARLASLAGSFAFNARPPAGDQDSLQYQIAALLAARDTIPVSYFPLPGGVNWIPTSPVLADPAQRFANMTEIVGSDAGNLGLSFISNSGIHYGTRQEIYIEDQPLMRGTYSLLLNLGSLAANFSENDYADTHSLVLLVDSLSLMVLFEELDPTFTAESGRQIYAAASKAAASSFFGTQGKAEGDTLIAILNALGDFFGVRGRGGWQEMNPSLAGNTWWRDDRRIPFENNIKVLDSAVAPYAGLLRVTSLIGVSGESLKNLATNGDLDAVAYRYALKNLNPFAVFGPAPLYQPYSEEVDPYVNDTAQRSGTLTGQYLIDRGLFLTWANYRNIGNINGVVPANIDAAQEFQDLARNDKIQLVNTQIAQAGGSGAALRDAQRYVFGGEGADRLEGNSKEDYLFGDGGPDYLLGKGGDDYLEGGRGLDLYGYNAAQPFIGTQINDGDDAVLDIDGLGVLRYTFTQGGILSDTVRSSVIVDTSVRVNDTTWQSADGKFEYEKQGADLVVTINGDAGGSVTLRDFRDGDFGIHPWTGRADPTTARTLEGDRKPEDADLDLAGDQLAYDSWGNVITTDELAQDRDDALFGRDDDIGDLVVAGGGNDILFGDTPMMAVPGPRIGLDPLQSGGADRLQGDSGRDFIDGGPGNDLIEGGFGGVGGGDSGGDVIHGALGDDSLYGDFRTETGAAIRYGETDIESGLKGDFISGGAGQDWLVGSAGNDALMGGGDKDVLVGGAGDDVIRGDDGQGATTLGWTVTRTPPAQNGPNVYQLDFTGTNFFDFSEGGADVIYGGAGEDWVFAEAGDDFVDGGSGNDVLFGGFGLDMVLGGAGNDVLVGDDGGAADLAEGGDYLDGGEGDDKIYGNGGDDIIVGGRGDDTLVGGAGKDVYVYDKGDGRDTIDDSDRAGSASSVIQFGPGLAREDVKFGVGSLKISFGSEDEIHVAGFDQADPWNTPLIGELRFDDGQAMTYADILVQGFDIDGTSAADLITGTGVVDRMHGLEGNDVLIGLDGDDFLYGGSGSDTLQGGDGNDYLEGGDGFDMLDGGAGDDSYVYDTFDTAIDLQGVNRILFDAGITPESLSVSSFVIGGQPRLLIERPGTTGAGLELRGTSLSSPNFVYAFADGRTLSQAEFLQAAYFVPQNIAGTGGNDTLTGFAGNDSIYGVGGNDTLSGGGGNDALNGGDNDDALLGGAGNDYLSGFDGNDALSGGSGADWLDGGQGSDTYLFGYGDGNDTVAESGADSAIDTVRLADGILLGDVSLTHEANGDLTVTLDGTQERLTLSRWYAGVPRVEQVVFADGTVIGESELAAISRAPIVGTAGNDVLGGTPYEDTLEGLAGDDVLDAGPNTHLFGDIQSNDLLIGGEGHDAYVLGWRGARDTVIEVAGETSTIRFAPGMTFDDVAARREGDDLFVHGRRTVHGLLLKNYYAQAHDWYIETALGSSMSLVDFLALPAPTTGDPVRDLWEARKTQVKHDWYAFTPGTLQADGKVYQAPNPSMRVDFGRTYDSGDWAHGTGGLPAAPLYASEGTTSFGAATVISSDAATQYWGVPNSNGTTTRSNATYNVEWNAPAISRTTNYYGTYLGFDLLYHSLYHTYASVSLTGTVEGVTLNAANGASGSDIVTAVMSGSPVPGAVNGIFDSTTTSFNPVEIRGGPSRNVISHRSFGMVDGGAGNDVIDSVGGGTRWDTAESGNFLYGGAGNDGITGSGDGDLIAGGPGNDQLAGWSGDDTYYFFAGDAGVDVVNEATWYLWDTYDGVVSGRSLYNADSGYFSEDTVEFGDGISLAGLTLSWGTCDSRYAWWSPAPLKTYDTLDIYWGAGKGVRVMMPDRFDPDVRANMAYSPGSSWGIEHFKFPDGMTLSLQQMADRIPTRVLNGTAGDDNLEGSAGNNAFFAGTGYDDLYGSFATDVYHFNLGDGEDWITDPGGNDTVVFGPGITPDMLSLGTGSLLIRVGSGGDALHIDYFDASDPLKSGAIETFQFADGTTLTYADLLARGLDFYGSDFADTLTGTSVIDRMHGLGGDDTLVGGAGDDLLDGGSGNDVLMGGEGSDTYRFDLGTGFDKVEEADAEGNDTDTVLLGWGITTENLRVARSADDIVLTVDGASDRLVLSNWFTTPGKHIERIQFADNTVWDAAKLELFAIPPNRAPVLAVPIADQTASEDAPFPFSVPAGTFTDADTDVLTYTALRTDGTALPAWLLFDPAMRTFSGTPAQADVGTVDVRVIATDPHGLSADDVFTLSVLNTNDAPVLANAIPGQPATEDALFRFTLTENTFVDADPGDTLALKAERYDATSGGGSLPPPPPGAGLLPPPPPPPEDGGSLLPSWLQFDPATRTFIGTPGNEDVGTVQIRVTVTDRAGASVSDVFAITVANVNDAPMLVNPIGDQAATEDSPFAFTVPANTIADPDVGDTLTWSASGANGAALPGWLTFDAVDRVFSGMPTNDDVGSFSVRVTATDLSGASASCIFGITVANTNDAPTLEQSIADQSATEDQAFALTVPAGTFADVDIGDSVTLSASLADDSPLPAWLMLDGSTLSGTPLNADVGGYDVKLTAADTAGANAADLFHLEVANVNDAPIAAIPLADQSFEAGSVFTFRLPAGTFADEDAGDSLALSASLFGGGALPAWLRFYPATATFTGSPDKKLNGISQVLVTATDLAGASVADDFGLVVRAPAGSAVSASKGDDMIFGGTGNETLTAKGGDDAIFAGAGDDLLKGGTGNDVLQGGDGDDTLRAGTGQNLLDGGAGNDLIFAGKESSLIIGGAGNDLIRTGKGSDVILFNRGDGFDTVIADHQGDNTLSFGGGIGYDDLTLWRSGQDLVVGAGGDDGVLLKNWYSGKKSVLNLQIVSDALADFDGRHAVQTFDFLGLVGAYDDARRASPGLTSWQVTNALLQWHLWGADDVALGGDLAYWYGKNRTLAGISLAAAQQVIGAAGFGSDAQSLHPFSGLQEGFVKLS